MVGQGPPYAGTGARFEAMVGRGPPYAGTGARFGAMVGRGPPYAAIGAPFEVEAQASRAETARIPPQALPAAARWRAQPVFRRSPRRPPDTSPP